MDEKVVKVRHATQCEFVPMTDVPDAWRGKRVRMIVEEIPEDEKTDEDRANHWPEEQASLL